ncbi:S41 family peptidase [Ramlibacter sp.]|uniref:S41 family peptidase n=1 Tax=Ramlibacter sp. TaxID=1917967 RepID=UPI002CAAAE58|nr:S41 family peptidase [Ramlibacter sp.]HWI80495.1 S41 family peptidase [Ramlibacter sp.]
MKRWPILLLIAALLQACGGGGGSGDIPAETPPLAQSCSIPSQRQQLRDFMQAQYYWYREMPAPDGNAPTMDAYFQSMLYRPTDRFSYSEPTDLYNQVFTEGRRTGYGYTLVWTDATRMELRVRNVEPLGPAARAGLARGDRVLAIDGYTPADIAAGRLPIVTTPGVPRTFSLASAAGQPKQLTVVSEDFALSPVAAVNTFELPGPGGPAKIGYLAYNQFVTYSREQLQAAFAQFARDGAGEVILDLRYNGGGSVVVSRELASLVGGALTVNQLYSYLRFNDQQAGRTQSLLFEAPEATAGTPLGQGLRRVFVIASGGTASASELLINGLKPFVEVVLIGETTYGKPYGFVPFEMCGATYQAVQFESLNSQGVGGFTAGFQPTCAVADDLEHQLGDPQEGRIAAALAYVATGRCSAGTAAALRAPKPAQEPRTIGEAWPRGMFVD